MKKNKIKEAQLKKEKRKTNSMNMLIGVGIGMLFGMIFKNVIIGVILAIVIVTILEIGVDEKNPK